MENLFCNFLDYLKLRKKKTRVKKIYRKLNTYFNQVNLTHMTLQYNILAMNNVFTPLATKLVKYERPKFLTYQGQVIDQTKEAQEIFPTVGLQQREQADQSTSNKRDI